MAGKSFLVWLVLAVSLGSLLYFPFLVFWINAPLQTWHLVLLFNIFFPAVLWWACKTALIQPQKPEKGAKKTKPEKAKPKTEDTSMIKLPGLEAKIPAWLPSLILGLIIAYPGLKNFASNYVIAAYLKRPFFDAIFNSMFLLWGFGIFLAAYTYLRSRKVQGQPYLPFHIHAPVLGAVIGIIAAVHVLFTIFASYIPSTKIPAIATEPSIYLSAFYTFFGLAGLNQLHPVALELVFGLFLIEAVVILSVFFSRRSRGINKAVEDRLIAKNIIVALAFYSILFLLIPVLFSPLSSVFKVWV